MEKASIAGSVAAGFPSPAEQYLEPPLDLNAFLVKRPAATYFVRVKGDSMEGRGIRDGDLLVVDRSLDACDGDVIIAAVDGEFTVKTICFDSISCSRSFGVPVETEPALAESLANFAAQAAEKMRAHAMRAAGCNIYAQFGTACEPGWADRTVVFQNPTNATNEILAAISRAVGALYAPGVKYRKSGVVFFGLSSGDAPEQLDFFRRRSDSSRQMDDLYKRVDALNRKYGRGKIFSASEGIKREWKMKRSLLSRRATTDWDELPIVK